MCSLFNTRFLQVLSKANSTSLIELSPVTGVKHQLRVHLGFGLACPVLGDHKYSHLQKLAPQVSLFVLCDTAVVFLSSNLADLLSNPSLPFGW